MTSPYTIAPDLWFAVLCEGFTSDNGGRISLDRVVSQFRLQRPPDTTGILPHAHIRGVLAVGLIGGFGEFMVDVSLVDLDDRQVWARPDPWSFSQDGGAKSAVLVQPFEHWLVEAGSYRFKIRMREPAREWVVRFEVAEQIGPPQQNQAPL